MDTNAGSVAAYPNCLVPLDGFGIGPIIARTSIGLDGTEDGVTVSNDDYRKEWLQAIHRYLHPQDLLIVLGPKKYTLTEPHNPDLPRIVNISMTLVLNPKKDRYKEIVQNEIRYAQKRGGRVFIGDSLLGLDPRPRDGWSFREHPEPAPAELDAFFGKMKTEPAFSASSERVWVVRPSPG